jgi:hypothetical protein
MHITRASRDCLDGKDYCVNVHIGPLLMGMPSHIGIQERFAPEKHLKGKEGVCREGGRAGKRTEEGC